MGKAVSVQQAFWFRNNDGNESTATFMGSQGSNQSIVPGLIFRLRIIVEETAGGTSNVAAGLQYSYNTGTYTDITGASTHVTAQDEGQGIADDTALTTQRLTYTGTFANGRYDDDGADTTAVTLSNTFTEYEFSIRIESAAVSPGDTLDFRVYDAGAALSSYTVTPRVTIPYYMQAVQGSYALTGQAVNLEHGRFITLVQGSYTLTGQAVTLTRGRPMVAAQGSYTLSGQATGLLADRVLAASQGSYTLSGQAVVLTYTPVQTESVIGVFRVGRVFLTFPMVIGGTGAAGAYTITINQGSYTLTGQAVNLEYGRIMALAQGSYTLSGQAVNLLKGYTIAITQGSYTLSGQAVLFPRTFVIAITQGSYTLSGQAVNLEFGRIVALAQGSYTLTGQAVNLEHGRFITIDQGSYTLSGQAVNLLYGHVIAIAQGSYTLSGQAITLNKGFSMIAAQGSYTLSGQAVLFPRTFVIAIAQGSYVLTGVTTGTEYGHVLAANQGSYTLSGQAVLFPRTFAIAIAQGSYTLSGQAVNLEFGRIVALVQGSYTLTGQAVNLEFGHVIAITQGSYTLSGQAVILTYSGGAYTITINQGSYTLTGQAVNLEYGRIMALAQGSYILSGQAVNLLYGHVIAIAQGSYTLSGQAVLFPWTHVITVTQGSYTLSGQAVNLEYGRIMALAQGSYTLTGQAVNLEHGRFIALNQGSYTLSGQAVNLLYGHVIALAQGSYTLSGQAVNLEFGHVIAIAQGSYTLSGQAVTLTYTPGGYTMTADQGSFVLSGQATNFLTTRVIAITQGSYGLTGQVVNLSVGVATAISAADLALLRGDGHEICLFCSILQPRTLWTAQVNDGTIGRSEQTIVFDGGAGSYFAQVEAHQTVWVGSAAGLADKGRLRIKSISSGDAGVTGTLVVGANEVDLDDDDYLTFIHNYELWSVFPRLDGSQIFYKDWNVDGGITYTDENENIPPVCIAGPHRAGFLSGGSLSFDVPIGDSYTMAPGAAISTQSVTVFPTTGVTVNPIAGGVITIDYTQPGQYWVKCSVTDDNAVSQITYRSHFVHVNDPSDPDYPFADIENVRVTGDWEKGGWSAGIKVHDNASFTEWPDNTLVLLWQVATFGSTTKDISLLSYGSNNVVCGYLKKDNILKQPMEGGKVDFELSTIENHLRDHFLFSVPIESKASPTTWYEYVNGSLTAGHIIHFLYRWHSTMLFVTDFVGLDNDDGIQRFAADFEKGTLYNLGDDLIRNRGIFAHLVCDKSGRIHMARDLTLRSDAVRLSGPVVSHIEDGDTSDPVTIVHNPTPRVAFVFASGLNWDGVSATPLGSTAPASIPSPFGAGNIPEERLMLSSQAHVNQLSGQIFAIENNPYPEVRVRFRGNYLGMLEPAIQQWWDMDLAAGDTIRGLIWADKKMIPRNITANFKLADGAIDVDAVFEPEVDGTDGVPYLWPTAVPSIGGDSPTIISPGNGLPGAIMTSSSLYYLPYNVSLWSLKTSDSINDAAQDPYWRESGKQNTSDPRQAIIYTAENTKIRKSTNAGTTLNALSPGNPPNDAGDAPAPVLADLDFIQLDPALVTDGSIGWIARWQNASSVWRSWILVTTNNGTSFSWKSIQ